MKSLQSIFLVTYYLYYQIKYINFEIIVNARAKEENCDFIINFIIYLFFVWIFFY